MSTHSTTASRLSGDDIAVIASGRPYLGGWGVGAPWMLTDESIATLRGQILSMATHEHADCVDGGDAGFGILGSVPPLVQVTAYMFEALQGPCVIFDSAAHAAILADFKESGIATRRSLSIVMWAPNFNWLTVAWQILRVRNDISTTAHILKDVLEMLAGVPPVEDAAREGIRLIDAVLESVPVARLDSATDDELGEIFAGALDEQGATALPSLRGLPFELELLRGRREQAAAALEESGIVLPSLEDLLVTELIDAGAELLPELRPALGGQTYMRLRERVAAGERADVDRSAISNSLARAIREGEAGAALQWTTCTFRLLWAALSSAGDASMPRTIALEDFADDLVDVRRSLQEPKESADVPTEDVDGGRAATADASASTDPWARLDRMIGLTGVKETVRRVLRGTELAQRRREAGVQLESPARHLLFLGNPGTGKTEVARVIGEIYRDRGVLRTGKLVETSRADLVGEGIGETAPKVRKRVAAALGGVLFIDEAYTLNADDGRSDYGQEAVNELMTLMETHRDDLVVIAAGYREQMQTLLRANPGLESRFGNRVIFDDFTDDELVEIYGKLAADAHLTLEEGVLKEVRSALPRKRTPRYGNAREMRRLFEATIERQGMRLSGRLSELTDEEVRAVAVADVREDRKDDEQRHRIFTSAKRDLDGLVGLGRIKQEVEGLVDEVRLEETLRGSGVEMSDDARHMLFLGNPGTGKTEVARILARIFHGLGMLSQGHLVEVHRSDLVAGYIGQTALKTEAKVESAIGGVLFIDEAYSLASESDHDFGGEAVDKLLTYMEDYREDLIVIAAGYGPEMDDFLQSNTGIASRFPIHLTFPDYSDDELMNVLVRFAQAENRVVEAEAISVARTLLAEKREQPGFGNARDVRTLFASAKRHQISRLADEVQVGTVTSEQLRTLLPVDFSRAQL
ncbi:AAA family ATPase [Brevibacterium jeotgali]|uniref:AAA+-type ATPase, SpoVK/Ycf46/Vps4 family n=1 Tax=Brevibacterium jeotgali TaxID=1262550 RepID=A0A2H1L4W4_9MICO|nr:AAA family ATPase [Brevibacterium jeotgali]TWC01688.1 SpoVK/Ycf46/Vps4 family AAA+-type ATPase [Brevibacterium jeotgali]SMY11433.1 AAA+-type ATPase, SpoVK/Ycf46/Vps4 family [Brevibacterium jeotgali]